jgi:hypothetical protein
MKEQNIEEIEKKVKEKGHTSLKLSEIKWLIECVKEAELLFDDSMPVNKNVEANDGTDTNEINFGHPQFCVHELDMICVRCREVIGKTDSILERALYLDIFKGASHLFMLEQEFENIESDMNNQMNASN